MSGAPDDILLPLHEALLAAEADADPADRLTVRDAVVRMLEEDRRSAYVHRQPYIAVSASVAIGKMLGLFEQPAGAFTLPINIVLTSDDRGLL